MWNNLYFQADIADPDNVIWKTLVEPNVDDKVLKSAFRAGKTKIVLRYINVHPKDRKVNIAERRGLDISRHWMISSIIASPLAHVLIE